MASSPSVGTAPTKTGWGARLRRIGSSSAGSSPLLGGGRDKKKEDKNAPQLSPLEKLLHDTGKHVAPVQADGNDKFFGMENFGNTCYANSILQSLYYSEPFREEVISYPRRAPIETILNTPDGQPRLNVRLLQQATSTVPADKQKNPASPATARNPATPAKPEDKNSAEYKKKQALLKGPIVKMDYDNSTSYGMTESLFTSLKDIFEGIIANGDKLGVLSPAKLVETLKQTNETFRSAMHQDAHEFLNLLLNAVTDTVEDDAKKRGVGAEAPPDTDRAPPSPTATVTPQTSALAIPSTQWVNKLFQGTLTSETRCLTCENLSQRDEPFIDLSVDIEQHSSVTACLRKFSEEEMLCERNKFHCDNCGGLQEAEKRMKIKRLPRILALHLKRFKYTEDFSRLQKLFHRVVYPFHLRLFNTTDDADDPDKLYELYAVVVHIGAGPYQGHYVSVVKTELGWILFDDELVEPVKKEFVQNFFGDRPGQACAYLLFYQETTLEAVKREQARERMTMVPRPAANAAKAHGLGLDEKRMPNGMKTSHIVQTPYDDGSAGDPLSKATTAIPITSPSPSADSIGPLTPLVTIPSGDGQTTTLHQASTISGVPSPSDMPNGVNATSPVQTHTNGNAASSGTGNLFSKMRRGSKSGKKSGFWGSLDLSKDSKGKEKEKEKDSSKRKSKDLVREAELNIPKTPSTAGLLSPTTPAAGPSSPAPTQVQTLEPDALPQIQEPEAGGEQQVQEAQTPRLKKGLLSLRRRTTELRKSSSRGTILGGKKEEKPES